jgi:hypothetical protein
MYMYMYPSTWCAVSTCIQTHKPLRQIKRNEPNETNQTTQKRRLASTTTIYGPERVRACVCSRRHEVIPTTRKPGKCVPESKATLALAGRLNRPLEYSLLNQRQKKSGHAAELNRPADRIAMAAKANFLRVRATCLRLPSKVPPKGETPVVRRALHIRNLAKKALKSHWICRWRRTDRGNEEERCLLDLLLLTST